MGKWKTDKQKQFGYFRKPDIERNHDMNNKDMRKHSRIAINVEAELMDEEHEILGKGRSKTISFGGVFVEIQPIKTLIEYNQCMCRLILGFGKHQVHIDFCCRVAHVQPDGIGLQFLSVEGDGYHHLKQMILMNCDDPDLLQEELEENPGLIVPKESTAI